MLSKRLQNLHPYVPGEQPKDRVYIKLNANENPYPPAKEVSLAIAQAASTQAEKIGLYPDPDSNELRAAIADMLNESGGVLSNKDASIPFKVTPEMIFCGNGSDEVLSFVFYSFFDSDRPLILPEHTYSFYPVYCGYYGIKMNKIPLKDSWCLDTEKMILEANKSQSCTIFANPNAPTGIALSREEVAQMIRQCPKDKAFIVDEAYCDFAEESCIPLLKEFKNLVIVRTFSKSLSFAGQRLGYIVANPEVIQSVFTVKNSFNHFPVDFLTQTAGIASCKNWSYYAETSLKVKEERKSMTDFLRQRGWFVLDSKTNFIFAKKEGLAGSDIYKAVKNEGILIRHFSTSGIEDFVRISIGTKEEMTSLKEAMKDL